MNLTQDMQLGKHQTKLQYKIVVFGGKDKRYDIPISEIQQVGANILIGLTLKDIINKYKVNRYSDKNIENIS